MPYASITDLPPEVRKRYSERCQGVFRRTFNEWDGDEAAKFKVAHTAAGNCQRSASKRSPLAMTDNMAVKFADGSDHVIEGIGIPYGGPIGGKDIQGEAFTKSTDFCLDWFEKRPLLYDHAINGKIKTTKIGDVTFADPDNDDGVFVRAELDKRSRYYKVVSKLIGEGALGFSSGAVPYLVQQDSKKNITRWPWFELSLTTTPANPDAVVYAVKATDALDHMDDADIEIPAPVEAALKALDEWGIEQTPRDSEHESLADHSQRVLAEVKAWVERVEEKQTFRAKVGRELSRANVDSLREAHRLIGELLARAEKSDADESEAAKSYAEFLRLEAEQLGAVPG